MVTVPLPAGHVAVIWVSELTTKFAAALRPKFTSVAPLNPDPVRITLPPPAARPLFGNRADTCGHGAVLVVSKSGGSPPFGTEGVIPGSLREPADLRTSLACWST